MIIYIGLFWGPNPSIKGIRDAGVGGLDRYEDIKKKNTIHEDIIVSLSESVDKLRRKIYIESKSQDDVVELAESKEKLFAAIPAIQPVCKQTAHCSGLGFWNAHSSYLQSKENAYGH
jgi:hypothetical protein